jgi:hypothetical protein
MEDSQSGEDGMGLRPPELTSEVKDVQKRPIPRLNSRQQALNKALLEKDTGLSTMYLGALAVLDSENPDRHALAAHDLRELMEKIPKVVEIKLKAQKQTLKSKVIELEILWKRICDKSACRGSRVWKGEIDKFLSGWLKEIDKFFRWFNEHYPRRKAETAATLRGLDGSGRSLPSPLEDLNIKKWEVIRNYFEAVAHHRPIQSPEELSGYQDELEIMLLDLLRPRTFEDFDLIDQIIQEAEGND